MKRLAILGASGHGKVVADCAETCGWQNIVFFDDAWPHKASNGKWEIGGDTHHLLNQLIEFDGVVVAIGDNRTRADKLRMLHEKNARVVSIVHPSAVVSRYAEIGIGSVIFAGAVVNVDVRAGAGVIINTGASVDHDCKLGACVHISPGARLAGGVTVGDFSWIGIGAVVKQMLKIGSMVVVGAGSAVIRNVSDGQTVIGIPGRPIDAH